MQSAVLIIATNNILESKIGTSLRLVRFGDQPLVLDFYFFWSWSGPLRDQLVSVRGSLLRTLPYGLYQCDELELNAVF